MLVYVLLSVTVPDLLNNDVMSLADTHGIFQRKEQCERAKVEVAVDPLERGDGRSIVCIPVRSQ
jgi:hypothetical protein